jgi:hypothetical protein
MAEPAGAWLGLPVGRLNLPGPPGGGEAGQGRVGQGRAGAGGALDSPGQLAAVIALACALSN